MRHLLRPLHLPHTHTRAHSHTHSHTYHPTHSTHSTHPRSQSTFVAWLLPRSHPLRSFLPSRFLSVSLPFGRHLPPCSRTVVLSFLPLYRGFQCKGGRGDALLCFCRSRFRDCFADLIRLRATDNIAGPSQASTFPPPLSRWRGDARLMLMLPETLVTTGRSKANHSIRL